MDNYPDNYEISICEKCCEHNNANKIRPSFEELEKATQPLVDILYKYYDPHTIIVIDMESIEILCGDMTIPFKVRD